MKLFSVRLRNTFTSLLIATAAMLCSCGPAKDIVYIQDLPSNAVLRLQEDGELRLQPGDRVIVRVHSRDEELARMFNINQGSGAGGDVSTTYTVDKNGKIDMPVLGQIYVEGLTRLEVAQLVKYRLLAGSLLRDPIVTVEFPEMAYYVIGESGVGRHLFPTDKLNIMEALSISGDLAISGKRTNVLVLRTENGQQVSYRVDLTRADGIYASPAYYLKQNDMIYVEPTQVKANQSTANGNSFMTPSFWMSLFTFGVSVAVLIAK